MKPKSETFEKIIADLNGGMAAKMFGMIGFKPNYTLEQLQEIEQEFQAMYGGREILPTTIVPFGFYLGETMIRNIKSAKWDFTGEFLCDVSIKIQGKDGGVLIAKPFVRFEKFLKDESDKPSTMLWLFNQLSQKTTKELMAEGTPITDGWYKFPDGHMFRFFIEKQKVLICNNCKEYWIAPKERCDCGSTTLTETHFSNVTLAKNYKQ